jgi:hypothetical protein
MAALRRELELDVQSVGDSARAMADWRFYVERFPFAAAAGAAVLGFLAVPKRPRVIVPDADTLAAMAKKNQVWVQTGQPKAAHEGRGMLGGLAALALTTAGKLAVNWARQQFKESLAARQRTHEQEETDEVQARSSHYPPR